MLYLVFEAGGHRLAVPAPRVAEVVPRARLRAVPGCPACVAGLLNHGGQLVPVVDLDLLLAGRPTGDRLAARIVLLERAEGAGRIGLCVSRVDRLRAHEQPSEAARGGGRLGAILQWEDDVAMVVDVDRIAREDVGPELLGVLPERSP